MFPFLVISLAIIAGFYQHAQCEKGCYLPEVEKTTFYLVEKERDKTMSRSQAGRCHEPGTVVEAVCFPGFKMRIAGSNRFFKCIETSGLFQWNATLPQRCVSVWSDCGMSSPSGKIFGGSSVALGDLPWMARIAIVFEGRVQNNRDVEEHCSGTLISSEYVLSAAHCFTKAPIKIIKISLGRTNFSEGSEEHGLRHVQSPEIHPNFTVGDEAFTYDVALLRLNPPVIFQRNIRPICLPDETSKICQDGEENACKFVTAAGWGLNEFLQNPSELKMVRLKLHPINVCSENSSLLSLNPKTHLCAGGIVDKEDACYGDSGGPLTCQLDGVFGKHYEIGVISFGSGCGKATQPGAYARTCAILPWLSDKMNGISSHHLKVAENQQPSVSKCKTPFVSNGVYIRFQNSSIQQDDLVGEGEQLVLRCHSPFVARKLHIVSCSKNGRWLPPDVAKCVLPPACFKEPSVPNGFVQSGKNDLGSRRHIRCSPGYQMHGEAFIVCQSNGKWSLRGTCILPSLEKKLGSSSTPKAIKNETESSNIGRILGITLALLLFLAILPALYLWRFKTWLEEPRTLALGRCPNTDNNGNNNIFHYMVRHHRRNRYDSIAERMLALVSSRAMIEKKLVLSDAGGVDSQFAEQVFNNKYFLREAKVGLLFWFDMKLSFDPRNDTFSEKTFAERQIRPILRAKHFLPYDSRDAPCHEELLKQLQHLYDCEIQSDRMRRFPNTIFVYNNVSGDEVQQYIDSIMIKAFREAWHIVIEAKEEGAATLENQTDGAYVHDDRLGVAAPSVEDLAPDEEFGSPQNSIVIRESRVTHGPDKILIDFLNNLVLFRKRDSSASEIV